MKYCTNCGTAYDKLSGICPHCYSDQLIPNGIIEIGLLQNKWEGGSKHALNFSFPGEKAALILSIIISIIIAVILGIVSFGLFIAILLINLIYLKISHLSSQKNMIRCSETNFRTIFKLAKVGAYRLKIPLPEVYITNNPQYNAYTTGFYKYGFIVINSSMARDFTPSELLFVIGHEMGHMKKYHTTWLNLLYPATAEGAKFIFAPVMQVIFNVWSVKAEHTADQAGLIACKDLNTAVLSLLKLAGGPDVEKEVDITKLTNPKMEQNEIFASLAEYLGTHPFIENRVTQLISSSSSLLGESILP
jgi:Zn-dependent protease with chaperone function